MIALINNVHYVIELALPVAKKQMKIAYRAKHTVQFLERNAFAMEVELFLISFQLRVF